MITEAGGLRMTESRWDSISNNSESSPGSSWGQTEALRDQLEGCGAPGWSWRAGKLWGRRTAQETKGGGQTRASYTSLEQKDT